jgi:hypothetical protein
MSRWDAMGESVESLSKTSSHFCAVVRKPYLWFLLSARANPLVCLFSLTIPLVAPSPCHSIEPDMETISSTTAQESAQRSVFELFERYDFDHDPTFQVQAI